MGSAALRIISFSYVFVATTLIMQRGISGAWQRYVQPTYYLTAGSHCAYCICSQK
jgi:hypothetical protein